MAQRNGCRRPAPAPQPEVHSIEHAEGDRPGPHQPCVRDPRRRTQRREHRHAGWNEFVPGRPHRPRRTGVVAGDPRGNSGACRRQDDVRVPADAPDRGRRSEDPLRADVHPLQRVAQRPWWIPRRVQCADRRRLGAHEARGRRSGPLHRAGPRSRTRGDPAEPRRHLHRPGAATGLRRVVRTQARGRGRRRERWQWRSVRRSEVRRQVQACRGDRRHPTDGELRRLDVAQGVDGRRHDDAVLRARRDLRHRGQHRDVLPGDRRGRRRPPTGDDGGELDRQRGQGAGDTGVRDRRWSRALHGDERDTQRRRDQLAGAGQLRATVVAGRGDLRPGDGRRGRQPGRDQAGELGRSTHDLPVRPGRGRRGRLRSVVAAAHQFAAGRQRQLRGAPPRPPDHGVVPDQPVRTPGVQLPAQPGGRPRRREVQRIRRHRRADGPSDRTDDQLRRGRRLHRGVAVWRAARERGRRLPRERPVPRPPASRRCPPRRHRPRRVARRRRVAVHARSAGPPSPLATVTGSRAR